MSSNNIDGNKDSEKMRFCAHLVVAFYFSLATYGVSKRDILGRTAKVSQVLKVFEALRLNLLVPTSFWRGAHCHIKGASSYAQVMTEDDDEDDDEEEMISVTVAEPTGLVHTIEIEADATVEELKERLCADTVASPQRLQLSLDGRLLEQEFLTLKAYGVVNGAELQAVPKAAQSDPSVTRPVSPEHSQPTVDEDEEPLFAAVPSTTRPASPEPARAAVAADAAADPAASLPPRPVAGAAGPAAVGVSRAASPNRGDRPLGLSESMRGGTGSGDELQRSSTGTFTGRPMLSDEASPLPPLSPAEEPQPFVPSPRTHTMSGGGNVDHVDLRATGFDYGHSPGYSPSQPRSIRMRGRDVTVDRKKVSPARNALVVRRISTKFERMEKKGWLRNTLYKVFHRPDKWKVVDILVYRTSKHGLAGFECCECFPCNECTAFIVFESPEMPLEIIRRHRDATHKAWLTVLLAPLTNLWGFCSFVCVGCCPTLPCRRRGNISPRVLNGDGSRVATPISGGILGVETVFGRSPCTDKLEMPNWELQPGPTVEDLNARADAKGRWKNLNRPKWQKNLTTVLGSLLLFTLTSLMICSSTVMEAVVETLQSADQIQQASYDLSTNSFVWPDSSPFTTFLSKYIPTLVNFLVIVGILPTLIDFVVYFIEPHYLMSDVYRSVLNKNLLLLFVSSLILPSLALTSLDDLETYLFNFGSKFLGVAEAVIKGESSGRDICAGREDNPLPDDLSFFTEVYSFITYPVQILTNGFGSAFSGEAAGYFFRYMTHATLLGIGAQLLLIPDKFYKTLSFVCCRKYERKVVWEFPLEYNYSIFCSTFAITMVYAIPHPPILFLGLFYAVFRAFGDKYALLFAHEGNLDSHFTDADEEGGADNLDGEGVQASASYHAKALNETVHNFLLLTIVIFQVAMYGFLRTDPNGNDRQFPYAEAMVISFIVSTLVYLRRTCAIRRTRVDEAVPDAVLIADENENSSELPDKPSGFGYYVDEDAFNESVMRLTLGGGMHNDGFTL
jgi:hypothetical protein